MNQPRLDGVLYRSRRLVLFQNGISQFHQLAGVRSQQRFPPALRASGSDLVLHRGPDSYQQRHRAPEVVEEVVWALYGRRELVPGSLGVAKSHTTSLQGHAAHEAIIMPF